MVLLKNKGGILPLGNEIKSMLVMGSSAANVEVLRGNYFGLSSKLTSILEGIIERGPPHVKIDYRRACLTDRPSPNKSTWYAFEAKNVDVAIVCVGLTPNLEGEEGDAVASPELGDRKSISLPPNQIDFLQKLHTGGGRVVLVVTGGSPVSLAEVHDLVDAILWVWYPGEEGGNAVADVLFGDANPGGRLPVTFPKTEEDLPPYADYSMAGRTYRYMEKEPLYPFGFGLGYTRFQYDAIKLDQPAILAGESARATVSLRNTGERPGVETVQCYIHDCEASTRVPIQKLVGFQKIALAPGASAEVAFAITPEMLSFVDEEGKLRLEPGVFEITVGGSSSPQRAYVLGAPAPQHIALTVK